MGDLNAHVVVRRESGFTVDVVLRVPAGGTTALLGPNGAGKSTIVSALAGLTPLDDGFIEIGGQRLDDPAGDVFVAASERGIGVVFQQPLLFPRMTVRQNIEFGPKSLNRPPDRTRRVVAEWMDRLELTSLANSRPDKLSGGEAQRVAIARTMAREPEVLILDEPLTAIDASARPRIRRDLGRFLESFEGPSIVITHDPAGAFLLADDVVIIEAGRVTHAGDRDEIRMRPATPYAADLAGVNLVVGEAHGGVVTVGSHQVHIADIGLVGEVVATIHPHAISLHRQQPEGSPRNTWRTVVRDMEDRGDTLRVATGDPLELIAEVTAGGAKATGLEIGSEIWVSIKATEISVRWTGSGPVAPV